MIVPRSEAELAQAVAGATSPLTLRGGGTRAIFPAQDTVLSLTSLTGVTLYEPAALTLVARAGTPLAEIDTLLASEGQRLGFEPPDLRMILGRKGQSTIGGVVSANAAGPRAVQLGTCRDALLGLRFVDGRGDVISTGGRVMKNVTGYDLVKLLAGSHGTLGVVSEVSLKVQSQPEAEMTLIFDGLNDAAGLGVLRRALGSPYDISGAARAGGRSYLRIEGMAGSVAYRAGHLRNLGSDCTMLDGAASAALWRGLRDLLPLQGRDGDLWRIACLPTDAAVLAGEIAAKAGANPVQDILFDMAGGAIWAVLSPGTEAALQACLAGGQGEAIKLRGQGAAPFAAKPRVLANLAGAITAQFDPMGLFRPRCNEGAKT